MSLRGTVALFVLSSAAFAAGQVAPPAAAPPSRQDLVVTNQNLALVTESRSLAIPEGRSELLWAGAPASARTETWSVVNATEAGVRFLGLTAPFAGDGRPGMDWFAALVGKRVRVQRPNGQTVEAEVLAVNGTTPAQVLFREGDEM
jgi:hypothetical protein